LLLIVYQHVLQIIMRNYITNIGVIIGSIFWSSLGRYIAVLLYYLVYI
jgi:hypothetical protein